jgi:hypothetical protein
MSVVTAKLCDLCDDPKFASGSYTNEMGYVCHACKKHIKEVKRYGLQVNEFKTLGDIKE